MIPLETDELGRDLWAWQKPVVSSAAAAVRRAFLVRGQGPSVALILSRSQSKIATRPRAVLYSVLRETQGWDNATIGRATGRCHKTVKVCIQRVGATPELARIAFEVSRAMATE